MSFLERVDQTIRRSPVWRSLFRQPYPHDEGAVGEMRVDRLIRQLAHETRLPLVLQPVVLQPVVLQPRRHQLVECAVQGRIVHLADVLRGDVVEWLEGVFALLAGLSPAGHAGQQRLAVAVLGDER